MKIVKMLGITSLSLFSFVAAQGRAFAGQILDKMAGYKQDILDGKLVTISNERPTPSPVAIENEDGKGPLLKETKVYQIINAHPSEVMAVFYDYKLHPVIFKDSGLTDVKATSVNANGKQFFVKCTKRTGALGVTTLSEYILAQTWYNTQQSPELGAGAYKVEWTLKVPEDPAARRDLIHAEGYFAVEPIVLNRNGAEEIATLMEYYVYINPAQYRGVLRVPGAKGLAEAEVETAARLIKRYIDDQNSKPGKGDLPVLQESFCKVMGCVAGSSASLTK